jgi:hypothetical protein
MLVTASSQAEATMSEAVLLRNSSQRTFDVVEGNPQNHPLAVKALSEKTEKLGNPPVIRRDTGELPSSCSTGFRIAL